MATRKRKQPVWLQLLQNGDAEVETPSSSRRNTSEHGASAKRFYGRDESHASAMASTGPSGQATGTAEAVSPTAQAGMAGAAVPAAFSAPSTPLGAPLQLCHAFFINLEGRTDKLQHITGQLESFPGPATRVPGVIYKSVTDAPKDLQDSARDYLASGTHNPFTQARTLGCYSAHMKAVQAVADLNTDRPCLILEDDMKLHGDWARVQLLLTDLPQRVPEWRAVLVDVNCHTRDDKGHMRVRPPSRMPAADFVAHITDGRLYNPSKAFPTYWGAHMVAVRSSEAATALLEDMKQLPVADVDEIYTVHAEHVYATRHEPRLVYQSGELHTDRYQ